LSPDATYHWNTKRAFPINTRISILSAKKMTRNILVI
jgi:hypothetical protein